MIDGSKLVGGVGGGDLDLTHNAFRTNEAQSTKQHHFNYGYYLAP